MVKAAQARRSRVTREQVEREYVHPAPDVPARRVQPEELAVVGARSLAKLGASVGGHVAATYNAGTSVPRWTTTSPDNHANPGPPVAPEQYRGERVECETVYVIANGHRVRASWENGKSATVLLDGRVVTLTAARSAIKGGS